MDLDLGRIQSAEKNPGLQRTTISEMTAFTPYQNEIAPIPKGKGGDVSKPLNVIQTRL
jgi:hypothetical protein